jgi:hypothetical protein
VFLNLLLELEMVCTDNRVDLLAVLEEKECRHIADAVLGCYVTDLVDIDLDEVDIVVRLVELDDLGRNHFAGSAPSRVEVDDHEAVLLDGVVELVGGLNVAVDG